MKHSIFLLRLVAATAVIFSHSAALIGQPQIYILGTSVGGWAVNVFFVISGYLLAGTTDFTYRYFWGRGLRIVPGMAATMLLSAV